MNPLSSIYGAASGLRNTLYDRGIRSAQRLQQPVVSVGNLSAGGTGKTPFVIALGDLLKARGISFDVLSRGYRRKTRGALVVEPDGNAADFGDEPLLIARRLGIPVIVGERRYEAGRLAEKQFDSQIHILDDGFQHRALARDFDIVLMTGRDFYDILLPGGRLREPLSSLKRADVIVLPEDLVVDNAALRGKGVWRITRQLVVPDMGNPPIAFCGIARPEQFFAQLRAAGVPLAGQVVFRDHHSYSVRDIERLLSTQQQKRACGFITTEKDAINLGVLQERLTPFAVAILNVVLTNPAAAFDEILKKVRR